jgi:hypothetical protein
MANDMEYAFFVELSRSMYKKREALASLFFDVLSRPTVTVSDWESE